MGTVGEHVVDLAIRLDVEGFLEPRAASIDALYERELVDPKRLRDEHG
jgi:hypothetical protein